MAALRRLGGPSSAQLCRSIAPPALLICCRGIVSKLFVGGMVLENGFRCLGTAVLALNRYLSKSGLSFYTTENALAEAFSQYGQVVEAKIVMDRVSDRSKGFGFITFASEDEAHNAVTEMNGKTLNGRMIFVDYAKPRAGSGGGMPIARGPPEPLASDA
ncbi:hypothetical protein CDL15_Pgr003234 [Punica granatum]|uniref:RRM domain-containing protein n=1 Tax=Punica granatum TaxID=22663 RepID=A0A218X280_PUNGR|nr:hypothetical protein CDL15_Pgr003234 [Punica granatum]